MNNEAALRTLGEVAHLFLDCERAGHHRDTPLPRTRETRYGLMPVFEKSMRSAELRKGAAAAAAQVATDWGRAAAPDAHVAMVRCGPSERLGEKELLR